MNLKLSIEGVSATTALCVQRVEQHPLLRRSRRRWMNTLMLKRWALKATAKLLPKTAAAADYDDNEIVSPGVPK